MSVAVEAASPREPGVRALVEASHELMRKLFAPEDIYALDIDALGASEIRLFAARDGDAVLGIGALAVRDGYGEIKSMFVDKSARGKGVAADILERLEAEARSLGMDVLKLETGEVLEAAVRLYERSGYVRCGTFGDYLPNTTSVYMEKQLD